MSNAGEKKKYFSLLSILPPKSDRDAIVFLIVFYYLKILQLLKVSNVFSFVTKMLGIK